MRKIYIAVGAISLLVIAAFAQTQQNEKKDEVIRDVTIKPDDVIVPAPQPQPLPGENVSIDTRTGDLWISYKSEGKPQKIRIELNNKIAPTVTFLYQLKDKQQGLISYFYQIANGPAEQGVQSFQLAIDDPSSLSDIRFPPGWRGIAYTDPKSGPRRYVWYNRGQIGLASGQALADPISFEASALPGLTCAYLRGTGEPPTISEGMSTWLVNRIREETRFEKDTFRVPIIGPRIRLRSGIQSDSVIIAVSKELVNAIGYPEFEGLEQQLTDLSDLLSTGDPESASSVKEIFRNMGDTPLQKAFFDAMVFNLEYSENLY